MMQRATQISAENAAEARAFLLAVVALSSGIFTLAFWFGVFQTVFFENLFLIWVVATSALLASLFLPNIDATPALKSRIGRGILMLPSLWLLAEAFDVSGSFGSQLVDWSVAAVVALVVLLTFPYILYVLILVTVPDVEQLRQTRYRLALPLIVLVIGLTGWAIGDSHRQFVTCEEFKVAGNDVPANCRPQADFSNIWPNARTRQHG